MKIPQNRNHQLNELTPQQVDQMALETLKNHLDLSSRGEQSSADNVLAV